MDRSTRRALIAAVLTLCVIMSTCAADVESHATSATYDEWVAKYEATPLVGCILAVTLIEDAPSNAINPHNAPSSSYTFKVKLDGQIWWQSSDPFGVKSGNGNPVDPEPLKRLKQLTSQLPSDAGSLPPPERRIVIQTPNAIRVYDRAQLVDSVTEILRLSGCRISSWRPIFESQSRIDTRAFGPLALWPDGKCLLNGTEFLAIPTYETLGDMKVESDYTQIAFSPDGRLAALCRDDCQIVDVSSQKVVRKLAEAPHDNNWPPLDDPHFTPDGRCLVLRNGNDKVLRFFDTRTWERVAPISQIPADAIQWKPSKTWLHAVMRNKSGVVSLWDAKTKSALQLDTAVPLFDAAFSPDESQVALVTSDKNGFDPRLRIFQTSTGQLVHELRVGELGCDQLRLPQWTPDGRYILAVTKPDSSASNENVSIWSVKTGRHRGDFVGCVGISGFVLLPPGDQLLASCNGTLHIWDFTAATKTISELEDSLAASHTP